MSEPFLLTTYGIDREVPKKTLGAYILGQRAQAVRRAATDLAAALQGKTGLYKAFLFQSARSAEDAFRLDCELYHRLTAPTSRIPFGRPARTGGVGFVAARAIRIYRTILAGRRKRKNPAPPSVFPDMRYRSHVASLVAVMTAMTPLAAVGEEVQVNQRFTAPTAHADTYAGLTLGQLVVALGLSLQGVPFTDVRRDMTRRLDTIEPVPAARATFERRQ